MIFEKNVHGKNALVRLITLRFNDSHTKKYFTGRRKAINVETPNTRPFVFKYYARHFPINFPINCALKTAKYT